MGTDTVYREMLMVFSLKKEPDDSKPARSPLAARRNPGVAAR
jgi:hypothetical protein